MSKGMTHQAMYPHPKGIACQAMYPHVQRNRLPGHVSSCPKESPARPCILMSKGITPCILMSNGMNRPPTIKAGRGSEQVRPRSLERCNHAVLLLTILLCERRLPTFAVRLCKPTSLQPPTSAGEWAWRYNQHGLKLSRWHEALASAPAAAALHLSTSFERGMTLLSPHAEMHTPPQYHCDRRRMPTTRRSSRITSEHSGEKQHSIPMLMHRTRSASTRSW